MAIKVSTLLAHNTDLVLDAAPTLGGDLDTNGFEIANGGSPVTISGNDYPITPGLSGQVLTTDGLGTLSWQNVTGTGTVTSVGLTSSGLSISVTGAPNPITGAGTFNVDLPASGVTANTYGSASTVGVFTVNSRGIVTGASNAPISITPAQAGLGNVTNQLQVINAGGAPSIRQGTGAPSGPDTLGAIYVDRAVTNGDGILFYDGAAWQVIGQKLNLYDEKSTTFTPPLAQGTNSIALGEGAGTSSTAPDSLAIGQYSVARIQGGVVQASGRFSTNGDAQAGRYLLRGVSPDGTPNSTELLVDGNGGSVRLVLLDNSTWSFRIMVTAHRRDYDDTRAGYTAAGVIYRTSGAANTFIQGSVNKVVLAESHPALDINIDADIANGSLRVRVTGEAGKQIRWVALVETVEITN